MKIEYGLPNPLGATWVGRGINFARVWANATRVEVCISVFGYEVTGRSPLAFPLEGAEPAA